MGMYTNVRFKGYIKPEFRKNFSPIALEGRWDESLDPVFKRFGNVSRACFIPRGASAYMPDQWLWNVDQYGDGEATDGFECYWNPESGYWSFQCSLKNYDRTIEAWFEILPYFVEKIEHLEYHYEEWDNSKLYNLIDGQIILVGTLQIQE